MLFILNCEFPPILIGLELVCSPAAEQNNGKWAGSGRDAWRFQEHLQGALEQVSEPPTSQSLYSSQQQAAKTVAV